MSKEAANLKLELELEVILYSAATEEDKLQRIIELGFDKEIAVEILSEFKRGRT